MFSVSSVGLPSKQDVYVLLLLILFSSSPLETNYLRIYWIDFHQLSAKGKNVVADHGFDLRSMDRSSDFPWLPIWGQN